jgi:hypothetical protein
MHAKYRGTLLETSALLIQHMRAKYRGTGLETCAMLIQHMHVCRVVVLVVHAAARPA